VGDVLPNTFGTLLAFSPVGYHVSAWYGQGGLRFTTAGHSTIQPYLETSAGIARFHSELTGIESGMFDVFTGAGLRLLDRTEPMATAGGGIMIGGGSVVADIGYRYRRFFTSNEVDTFLTGGRLATNEVRFGIGVRF